MGSLPISAAPTNMLQTSLAYKAEVTKRMLDEINLQVRNLPLPGSRRIQAKDLVIGDCYFGPPRMGGGGVLRTTNLSFAFYTHGKLWKIGRADMHPEKFELYPRWANTPSLVDTNGAYQLATQWLRAMSVDVPALEKKYELDFYQWFYWARAAAVPDSEWNQHPPTTNKVMLPIFDVRWGGGSTPPVKVTVFGPTKELVALELNDISFSRRPPIVITNWEELLNTPAPPQKQLKAPSPTGSAERTNPSPAIRSNPTPPFQRRIGSVESP